MPGRRLSNQRRRKEGRREAGRAEGGKPRKSAAKSLARNARMPRRKRELVITGFATNLGSEDRLDCVDFIFNIISRARGAGLQGDVL